MTTAKSREKGGVALNWSTGTCDGDGCINGALICHSSVIIGRVQCSQCRPLLHLWDRMYYVTNKSWKNKECKQLSTEPSKKCCQHCAFLAHMHLSSLGMHSVTHHSTWSDPSNISTSPHQPMMSTAPNNDGWTVNKHAIDTPTPITSTHRQIQSHPYHFLCFLLCGHFQSFLC